MEYYDKYGNIKRINVQFEPVKPVTSSRRRDSPQVHKPMASFGLCDECEDKCFYGRYRQYCSDDFVGKCDKAQAHDERQRLLKIILNDGGAI